jgi:hypothetical protein
MRTTDVRREPVRVDVTEATPTELRAIVGLRRSVHLERRGGRTYLVASD